MQLKTENYKGIAIRVISKILAGRRWIEAKWIIKGKKFELKGNTKEAVVTKAKQIIDKFLK